MHKVETKSGFKNVIPCINTTARARVLTGFFSGGTEYESILKVMDSFVVRRKKGALQGRGGVMMMPHTANSLWIKNFVYRYRRLDVFVYACHGSAQRGTQFFLNITDIPPEWICEHMSFSH